MFETVIFAIDLPHDTHTQARFLRHIDTQRAMGKMTGLFASCIGCYEGRLERNYMMLAVDYNKFVRDSGFVDYQECILRIPGDTRQPSRLEFKDNSCIPLGPCRKVSSMPEGDWTYVEATDSYWVC